MNARNELAKRLVAMVSEEIPANVETINSILKDYAISREAEEEKSDLNKRIWYYLGAKRIDGLSPRTQGAAQEDTVLGIAELAGVIAGDNIPRVGGVRENIREKTIKKGYKKPGNRCGYRVLLWYG